VAESKFWFVVEGPRFRYFPWLWRETRIRSKICDYTYACDIYNKAASIRTKRQTVILGAQRGSGNNIQLIHTTEGEGI